MGGVGTLLFESAFWVANFVLPYWVSYIICFELITDLNFIMHDSWTFQGEKQFSKWHRFTLFQSGAVGYRIVQYVAFFILGLLLNLYLALYLAILVAFGYSYFLNKRITWKVPNPKAMLEAASAKATKAGRSPLKGEEK